MKFEVKEIRPWLGENSYCARYDAEIDVFPGDGSVVIEHVGGYSNACPELQQQSLDAIREGAEEVLRPRGLQATMRLEKLTIHPVDCKPDRYRSATVKALAAALDAGAPSQE